MTQSNYSSVLSLITRCQIRALKAGDHKTALRMSVKWHEVLAAKYRLENK